ncbi:MAG: hypothetical protein ACO1NK_12400 [Sediminibacterium sp.]
MKKIFAILFLVHLTATIFAQTNTVKLHIRVPIQYEQQKADVSTPFGMREARANAVNFGTDVLLGYTGRRVEFYGGVGYFRNRFNIRREYDHQALNIGTDSIPFGTEALNYTYSLLRTPIGFSYSVFKKGTTQVRLGIEHFFNFSFRRKYNGAVPFSGARNTSTQFSYFGNSANLLLNLRIEQMEFGAYVRMLNNYKKDKFLKEDESETVMRYIDAFGISLTYSFSL